jgi:hypothetical protein
LPRVRWLLRARRTWRYPLLVGPHGCPWAAPKSRGTPHERGTVPRRHHVHGAASRVAPGQGVPRAHSKTLLLDGAHVVGPPFGSASDSYNTQPVKTTKRTRGESREVGGGALRLRQAPGRRGSRKPQGRRVGGRRPKLHSQASRPVRRCGRIGKKNTTRTPGGPDSTSPSPRGYGECPARTSMLWGLALRPRRKGGKCSNSQWRSLLREDKKRRLANHQRCHKFSP